MAEYIDVDIAGGEVLLVEVPPESENELVEAGRVHDLADTAVASFAETLEAIGAAANLARSKLRTTDVTPSEITVEFGIQLAASAGVVVASTAATANMKLIIRWSDLDHRPASS